MSMESDILKDFLAESKENLELLDQQFVELEQDPENADLIKSIFRTIHTIKGTSGFFGFTTLEGIAHFAEDILSKLRDGVIKVNEDIASMLLKAVDHIKIILSTLEKTGKEPTDLSHLDFIVDLRNFSEKITKGGTIPKVRMEPKKATEIKEVAPPAEEPAASSTVAQKEESEEIPHETSAEKEDVSSREEDSEVKPEPPPAARAQAATPQQASNVHLTETHVRVDVNLLDKLMNLAGELVLSRNRLVQIASVLNNPDLLAANQRMSLIVTELQEQIMKTRMQPVGNVFNKFPRIVRDLAKMAKKQVQLKIEGAETELDRSIVDVIKDPLTHMVRNSIDHGIEAPDIRVQKDKPEIGTLIMRAYHEGGQVIIEIKDDGAGINPVKIRKKAIEKGVITQEQASYMSDRDAVNLVFAPGFSTAEQVTNISGRGVGMDVVRTNIEKLGGTVELQSEVGHGTTVKVKIPLTLAIIPALIVKSNEQRYCIPQVNLVELVSLGTDEIVKDIQIVGDSEFYRLRGEILPLLRLDSLLAEAKNEQDVDGMHIVVLNSGERHFGLVVDEINDSEEIVVKPLGKYLKNIETYAGTTLMGDGKAALILDVVGMTSKLSLKAEESMQKARLMSEGVSEEDKQFLLLFKVAYDEYFAIPLGIVNRLDKIKRDKVEVVGGREVVQYRGHSMPLIRLESFLPISPLPDLDEYHLIVFNMNNRDIAVMVSAIEDSMEISIDIEEHTFKQDGILGSAIVKERTTLFLDVYQIIQMYDPSFFEKVENSNVSRLMLAEDSNFYRNLLHSYLTASGYDVIIAKDGQEAWDLLQREPVDLLITDVEMPRMTGLELTRKIRESERLRKLPIITVTSLSSEDDKRKGIQAGVDEYQAKLDRDKVLYAIEKLLKQKAIS